MAQIGALKIKAQVFCELEIAMGPGKADLLEAIAREGSISGAGRAMGMSYRRTWMLVDTMNRCWREPLVETRPGGGKQSGAQLTHHGQRVLAAFRTLEARLITVAQSASLDELEALMAPSPRAPKSLRGRNEVKPS